MKKGIILTHDVYPLKKVGKSFFHRKHENNSVEIPLSYGHVEIEIKIKDKKKGED